MKVRESTFLCTYIINPVMKTIHKKTARAKNAVLISWMSDFCLTTQSSRCCWPSGRFNSSRPIKVQSSCVHFYYFQNTLLCKDTLLLIQLIPFFFPHTCACEHIKCFGVQGQQLLNGARTQTRGKRRGRTALSHLWAGARRDERERGGKTRAQMD